MGTGQLIVIILFGSLPLWMLGLALFFYFSTQRKRSEQASDVPDRLSTVCLGSPGSDWYYMVGGKKTGPANQAQIRTLLGTHVITQHTLVWRNEFGNKWKEIQDTDLWTGRVEPYLTPSQKQALRWVGLKPTERAFRVAAGIATTATLLFVIFDFKDVSGFSVTMVWLVVGGIFYRSMLEMETADQTWHRRRKEEILGEPPERQRSGDRIR